MAYNIEVGKFCEALKGLQEAMLTMTMDIAKTRATVDVASDIGTEDYIKSAGDLARNDLKLSELSAQLSSAIGGGKKVGQGDEKAAS